jgi:phosphonate transport system substrate-binding protein
VIRLGVALTKNPRRTQALLAHLGQGLGRAAGLDVHCATFPGYQELVAAMDARTVDLAWLPPMLALRAVGRARMVPIALPVRDGAAWYETALFTARGDVHGIDALVGLKAAWVDRHSASGYAIIRASLRAKGVNLEQAFASETFYGSHEEVVRAVLAGEADVGATYVYPDHRIRSLVVRGGWGQANISVIAREGPIPADVLAASITLPATVSRAVQDALFSLADKQLARAARALLDAERFVPPQSDHLERFEKLIDQLESAPK